MRGQVFEIDGDNYFTMGGAYSHDKEWRTEGINWWAEEVPSQEERDEAIANLTAHNWKVDYVITHEAPTEIADKLIAMVRDYSRDVDEYVMWLGGIAYRLDFKTWYHGHHHIDWSWEDGKYMSMYDYIIYAGDMEGKNLGSPWRRLSDFW